MLQNNEHYVIQRYPACSSMNLCKQFVQQPHTSLIWGIQIILTDKVSGLVAH